MPVKTMTTVLALSAALGLAAGIALAADPPPPAVAPAAPAPTTAGGKAVVARQAHYRELNAAFRALNEELRKDAPDKAALAADAGKMRALAEDLPSWFPKGSGPEAGVKTAAKAEIWTDAAGFGAAASGLQTETVKLEQAAMAGDLDALRAQARVTGGACKTCHDQFRAPPEQHPAGSAK
jgi:cytochrome c556